MKFKFFELGKYSISTLIAFTFDILTLYILTDFFLFHYMLSALMAVSIGFSINYILNVNWVFKKRTFKENPILEYNFMVLISVGTSAFNIILVWLLTDFFFIYYVLSKFIASLISFLLKFLIKKRFLFSR
tara:strand:+ start:270 stop:659 length:390 start_codon:yes stop_codon:yes gene_type:complete